MIIRYVGPHAEVEIVTPAGSHLVARDEVVDLPDDISEQLLAGDNFTTVDRPKKETPK